MIATWMATATLLGLLIAIAAAAAAALLGGFRRQQRWAWLAAMLVSVTVPILGGAFARQVAVPSAPTGIAADPAVPFVPSEVANVAAAPAATHSLDLILLGGWAASSLLLAVLMLLTWRRTTRQLTSLAERQLCNQCVTASVDFGPAVVGWLRPRVVVPSWVFELPEAEQRLVLMHETEHMASRDQLLLLAGIVLVVLMPWNLALWWQLRRLRVAMEVDCDARVALVPAERARYGKLLVTAHEQRHVLNPMMLSFRTSSLGERLHALLRPSAPTRRQLALRSSALLACGVFATRVPVPYLAPTLRQLAATEIAAKDVRQPTDTIGRKKTSDQSVPASRLPVRGTRSTLLNKAVVKLPTLTLNGSPPGPVVEQGSGTVGDLPPDGLPSELAIDSNAARRAVGGRGGRGGTLDGAGVAFARRGDSTAPSGLTQFSAGRRLGADSTALRSDAAGGGAVRASGPATTGARSDSGGPATSVRGAAGGRGGRGGPPLPEPGARLLPRAPGDTSAYRFVTLKGDTVSVPRIQRIVTDTANH